MPRLDDYRGYEIWQYPSGLFYAFYNDKRVGPFKMNLSAIHRVVDNLIEESENEREIS